MIAMFDWLWLVLICYEKTLLVAENSTAGRTVGWLADKPNEQSGCKASG